MFIATVVKLLLSGLPSSGKNKYDYNDDDGGDEFGHYDDDDDGDDDGDDDDDNDYGKCNSYYDALRYNQQTIASQPQALVC